MLSKNWCFTLNNPEAALDLPENAKYLIYGRETAKTTGTKHYQGFIVWLSNQRLSACKKFLPEAHWEAAKGSFIQASDYCKKEGDYTELGSPPLNAKRKGENEAERWKNALEAAKTGHLDDIPEDIRFRYYRTCKEIAKDHMVPPPALDHTTGAWWYGDSGTGKSRTARQDYPGAYLKMCNKWWDGYQGEETVIIDDFDKVHGPLCHHLKIWGDHYPFLAETKGGAIMIRPKRIIVTSNYLPSTIWPEDESNVPIQRRYPLRIFE